MCTTLSMSKYLTLSIYVYSQLSKLGDQDAVSIKTVTVGLPQPRVAELGYT